MTRKILFTCIVLMSFSFVTTNCGGGGSSSGAPDAPTALTATISDNAGELAISWTSSTGASSYNLYWGTTAGVTKETGTKIENVSSPYSHTGLTNGTTYYYIATAVSSAGESAASTEANGVPEINPVGTLDTEGLPPDGYIRYTANVPPDRGYSSGATIDSSGRIVITGSFNFPTIAATYYMGLWRYNPDGTIDTTFGGGDGYVMTSGTATGLDDDHGNGVVIDSSGNILVAGYGEGIGVSKMIIWKFDSNGDPVTTFGTNGHVIYERGFNGDAGNAIALDSSGNILVAGISTNSSDNNDMALWKYTSNGTADTSFGSNGVVFEDNTAGGGGEDAGIALAIGSGDRIVVAGRSEVAPSVSDLVIWCYTGTGIRDTSFSGDGAAIYDGGDDDSGSGITFDSDGRVLATGYVSNGSDTDFAILRYTSAGEIDTSFAGGDGVYIYSTGYSDSGNIIKIDSRGRPVAVGYSGLPSFSNSMAVIRLDDTGTPDTTFSGDGIVLFSYQDGTQNNGTGLNFDTTGRIVVSGTIELSSPSPHYFVTFWRYL